jgi:hypothetical protein
MTEELIYKYIEDTREYKNLKILKLENLKGTKYKLLAHIEYEVDDKINKGLFGININRYNEWYSQLRNDKIDEILKK